MNYASFYLHGIFHVGKGGYSFFKNPYVSVIAKALGLSFPHGDRAEIENREIRKIGDFRFHKKASGSSGSGRVSPPVSRQIKIHYNGVADSGQQLR